MSSAVSSEGVVATDDDDAFLSLRLLKSEEKNPPPDSAVSTDFMEPSRLEGLLEEAAVEGTAEEDIWRISDF